MPALPTEGDVIQVTLQGFHEGQIILNVFHYVFHNDDVPVVNTHTFLQGVNIAAATALLDNVSGIPVIQSTNFEWQSVTSQIVYPDRSVFARLAVSFFGAVADGQDMPVDTHVCVSLQSDGTGRGKSGNKKICGMKATQLDADNGALWADDFLAAVDTVSGQFAEILIPVIGEPDNTLDPIVWSPKLPTERRELVDIFTRDEVRVEPSRRFRKGI